MALHLQAPPLSDSKDASVSSVSVTPRHPNYQILTALASVGALETAYLTTVRSLWHLRPKNFVPFDSKWHILQACRFIVSSLRESCFSRLPGQLTIVTSDQCFQMLRAATAMAARLRLCTAITLCEKLDMHFSLEFGTALPVCRWTVLGMWARCWF